MVDHPTGPPKLDAEHLVLRARPQAVTRFNRKVVIAIATLASAAVLGATMVALNPPNIRADQGPELYNVDRKAMAEGLAMLPRNYGDLTPKQVPVLGPPLPGDMGKPVLRAERELKVVQVPTTDDRDSDEDRAERLRLARQAQKARESGVFFQMKSQARAENGPGQQRTPAAVVPEQLASADMLALDPERDQNNQQRKLNFLNAKPDRDIYNPHALQEPISPYQVMAGSIISASLITGINSDLPGLVTAQVTEQVYDSVTGKTLLIPQGTKLIGKYDSVIAFGQSRALVVWNRIVMPDGTSLVIDNLPGTDVAGYAGLEDQVDYHTFRLITGIVLSTLLGVGTELSLEDESDLVRALRRSAQGNTNRAGQRITERNLNIQPTITIRPGSPLRVIVHKDLVLRPYRG